MRQFFRAAAALAGFGVIVALARRLAAPHLPKALVGAEAPGEMLRSAPSRSPDSRTGEITRRQLYDKARRLGIKGRSKMSKKELTQAVVDATKGES